MLSKFKTDNWAALFIAVFINIAFVFVPVPLFDEDEGFTAEIARGMLENKEFVLLESNFQPRYDKPPLAFWVMSGSLSLFGNTEFAVRFPSLLFSLGVLFLLFYFTKRWFDKKRALTATLICVGTLQFSLMAKAAIADPYLYFFVVGASFSFIEFVRSDNKKFLYFFTIANALAFLTKGPIILFISALVVLASALYLKKWKILFKVLAPLQILIFFAMVLPWFWLSYQKVGMLIINEFFFKHNISRFSNSMEGHSGSYLYFVVVFLLGFLPFSIAQVQAILWKKKPDLVSFVLWIWFWGVFVFFTLSATKLPHYLMLGFFPLAVLSSGNFSEKMLNVSKIAAAIFVFILLIAPTIAMHISTDDVYAQKLLAGFKDVFTTGYYILLCLCFLCILWSIKRKGSYMFLVFFLVPIHLVLINYGQLQQGPIKELAEKVDTHIVMKNHYLPSFSFYLNKSHYIRDLLPGDYSVGKIIDFKNYKTRVLYEKYGTVWVEILE